MPRSAELQPTVALRRRNRDGGGRLRLIMSNHPQNHHLMLMVIPARLQLLRWTATTTLVNAGEDLLLQKVAALMASIDLGPSCLLGRR